MQPGPRVIQSTLRGEKLTPTAGGLIANKDGQNIIIKPLRNQQRLITTPQPNTRHWLNAKVQRFEQQKALDATLATITFEARQFNILRLDDHINLLAESVGISKAVAAEVIIQALNQKNEDFFAQIQFGKLTFQHQETREFYGAKKIVCLTNISSDKIAHAINGETSYHNLNNIHERVTGWARQTGNNPDEAIRRQKDDVKQEFYQQIKKGIVFLENITKNLDQFPLELRTAVCEQCA